jgi:hypothetical protein
MVHRFTVMFFQKLSNEVRPEEPALTGLMRREQVVGVVGEIASEPVLDRHSETHFGAGKNFPRKQVGGYLFG